MARPTPLPPRVRSNQRADWADALKSAREHPGEWIRVAGMDGRRVELSKSVAREVRMGHYAIDPAEIEVATRSEKCAPGMCQFYIRTREGSDA